MAEREPSARVLRWPVIGRVGVVALVVALMYTAAGGGRGEPNYLPFPTLACLRANGFTVSWLSSPYTRPAQRQHWVTRWIARDGQGLRATFVPSPALATRLAPISDYSSRQPWTWRNVIFSHHTATDDGPVIRCLTGSPRRQ